MLGSARVAIDHFGNNHDGIKRSYCPVVYCDVCGATTGGVRAALDVRMSRRLV